MTSVNGVCPCKNYRRGVFQRPKTMFAGRGISLPGLAATAGVVVVAFGLGLVAGWITDGLPGRLHAEPSPSASPTPTPGLNPTVEPSLPPLGPVTRDLTVDDRAAGIVTTDYVVRADGTFTVVAGKDEPDAGKGDVRWVSFAVEDGVSVDAVAFRGYVMSMLNDNRAWGTEGQLQFVATDGVADYRVVLASPYTTAAVCPDQHVAVTVGPVTQASPTPSADATPPLAPQASGAAVNGATEDQSESAYDRLCADDGVIVLSAYDWIAGLPGFADDHAGARKYVVLHRMGHLMGREDSACATGRAAVMDLQHEVLPEGCEPNPWPYPDAPATLPTPPPTPTPASP